MVVRNAGENIITRIGNANICYNDIGPTGAPVMIFIHGFPLNKKMWELQAEVLKSNFRIVSMDLRGFGDSSGESDMTMDTLVSDLISLMDHLAIDAAMVCGHSLGGYVTLNAIYKHPQR